MGNTKSNIQSNIKTIKVHPSQQIDTTNSNLDFKDLEFKDNFESLPKTKSLLNQIDSNSTLLPSKTNSSSSFILSSQASIKNTENITSQSQLPTSLPPTRPPTQPSCPHLSVSRPPSQQYNQTSSQPSPHAPSSQPSSPHHSSPLTSQPPTQPSSKHSSPSRYNDTPKSKLFKSNDRNKVYKQINDNPVWNFFNGSWFGSSSNKNQIISQDLIQGQLLCLENPKIRNEFLSYICDRKWLTDLNNRLDLVFDKFNSNNNHYLTHLMDLHTEDVIFNDYIIYGNHNPISNEPNLFSFDNNFSKSNDANPSLTISQQPSLDEFVTIANTEQKNLQPQDYFILKKNLTYQKFNTCALLKIKDSPTTNNEIEEKNIFGIPKSKSHFLLISVLWTLFQYKYGDVLSAVSPYFNNLMNVHISTRIKTIPVSSNNNIHKRSNKTKSDNEKVKRRIRENLVYLCCNFTRDEIEIVLLKSKWYDEVVNILDDSIFSICVVQNNLQSASISDSSSEWSKDKIGLKIEHPLMKIKNKIGNLPIQYVNKPFEKLTLFEKNEILSKDFISSNVLFSDNKTSFSSTLSKFSSSDSSKGSSKLNKSSYSFLELESDQYIKLSYSIQKKESIKLLLTSTKNNGENYYNFVTSRPILNLNSLLNSNTVESDENTDSSLNLFVYYNLNSPQASLKDIREIDDFITLYSLILG